MKMSTLLVIGGIVVICFGHPLVGLVLVLIGAC